MRVRDDFFSETIELPKFETKALDLSSCDLSLNRMEQLAKVFPDVKQVHFSITESLYSIVPEALKGLTQLEMIVLDCSTIQGEPENRQKTAMDILENGNLISILAPYKLALVGTEASENWRVSWVDIFRLTELYPNIEKLEFPAIGHLRGISRGVGVFKILPC